MTNAPTHRTYTSLDAAYDHFNHTLFDGKLPACLITMQRHHGAYGYFCGNRFVAVGDPKEVTDEIALNPSHFAERSPAETLSTLVHEMVHLWQHHFGKPSRTGYHNKQWAEHMRTIGLIPSDTGLPGGKEVGQRVSHYIEEGGQFDKVCAAHLAAHGSVLYQDRAAEGEKARKTRLKKAASKTKYTCPVCGLNAWAKPDVHVLCGDCGVRLEPEENAG